MDKKKSRRSFKKYKKKVNKNVFNHTFTLRDYIYQKKNTYCCPEIEPQLLFNNIEPYDYVTPLKKMSTNNNEIEYFKEALQNIRNVEELKKIGGSKSKSKSKTKSKSLKNDFYYDNDIHGELNEDEEQMLMYYLLCRPNMNVISIYPKAIWNQEKKNELLNLLLENGNIYYIKKIELSTKGACNLLYHYYAQSPRMKNINQLEYKVKRLGWEIKNNEVYRDDIKKSFYILFYENTKPIEIRGSSTPFKGEIRNIWLKDVPQKDINAKNGVREYDFCHINDTQLEAHDYIKLLLNKNNIEFLENQNIYNFIYLRDSHKIFNTLKNILIQLYSTEEQLHYLFMSSIILFLYGLRNMNDVDGYVHVSKDKSANFYKKIIQYFSKEKVGEIYDISIPNYGEYTKEWNNVLQTRAKKYGTTSYNELVYNPKYHITYMGIKILNIKYDLLKRIDRARPASIADLVVIRLLYPKLLTEELYLPLTQEHYNQNSKKTISENLVPVKILSTTVYYLKTRYNIILSENILKHILHIIL